jgi:hypothetical protein
VTIVGRKPIAARTLQPGASAGNTARAASSYRRLVRFSIPAVGRATLSPRLTHAAYTAARRDDNELGVRLIVDGVTVDPGGRATASAAESAAAFGDRRTFRAAVPPSLHRTSKRRAEHHERATRPFESGA